MLFELVNSLYSRSLQLDMRKQCICLVLHILHTFKLKIQPIRNVMDIIYSFIDQNSTKHQAFRNNS